MLITSRPLPTLTSARRAYSDQEDNKPDKTKKDKKPTSSPDKPKSKSADGQNRLNALLASMSTDSTLNLVKTVVAPKAKVAKKNAPKKSDEQKANTVEEAAHDVAKAIGGDVQKTESELLAKLLKRSPDAVDVSITDLISGMQIDGQDGKSRSEHPKTRAQFVRKSVGDYQQRQQRGSDAERGRGGEGGDQQQRERFQRRTPRPVDAGNVLVLSGGGCI